MNFKDWYDSEESEILENSNNPPCPKCGAPMTLRTNRQNGNQFYGCSNFGKTGCKGSGAYNPNYKKPVEQQPQQVKQVAQTPTIAQNPASRTWTYAKITKKGDKRFPVFGKEIAASKRQDGNWDYIVLDNPQDKGLIYHDEISSGLIQSLRDLKTGKSLTTQNPSLEDLEQKFSSTDQEEAPNQQQAQPEQKKNNKTIAENQISQEQTQIDQRFGDIVNGKQKQHIMINALAGTGKTTMLKHLAWKYGKPGQKWLYIVFNTKNKVEASEEFPSFVDVRTSNGFLGEVLQMPQNINNIGNTERMIALQNNRSEKDNGGGKLEKSRLIADSPEFSALMKNLGIPEKVDLYQYGKVGKTLNSLLKGIQYNFKESVLQLVGLGKSFALDPRNGAGLSEGLDNIFSSYDIDTEMIDTKERIAKYGSSYRDTVEHYLEEILGYDFMTKNFQQEIKQATVWMMTQLMPNATRQRYGQGRLGVELANFRDFDDDLWYAATHANQLVWPKYNIVLADEVQDFNENQKIMLQKLSENGARIVAVGDPNQSIYRFRGADGAAFGNLSNMLGQMSEGDGQVVYNLTNNFRSRPEILDFANEETHVKGLKSGRTFSDGKKGVVTKGDKKFDDVFDSLGDEVKQAGGKVPIQTAFISRTNEPLVKTALQLLAQKIPFLIVGKDIAKDLIKHIRKISAFKQLSDSDPSRALAAELSAFLDDEKDSHHGKSTKKAYLQETEETTNALLASIESYESETGGQRGSIGGFKNWIAARLGGLEVDENEKDLRKYKQMVQDQNPVILTTAHKSKGLEFSRVYVLRYDQFPHPKAQREEDLQQEENSKYVTLTRAKDELHILDLEGQPGYKGKVRNNSQSDYDDEDDSPVSGRKNW